MGVKSLWELLSPVGRPVMLETMEGKAMAIDSSIWIYQFQATMRDKEGRGLVNAHVLGFLRRISKLMFYGIKPVFVFDGGAPALKRSTLSERKQKKLGAAASHAKVAEKLLAAQLRRRAVDDAQARQRRGKDAAGPALIDDNTVYLEDVDPTAASPRKPPIAPPPQAEPSPKKSKWQDHDPYRLPEVDLPAVLARAADELDPRFATEEELREAVESLRPEDVDVSSDAFRSLPAAVQYEIMGDLRLRSRQTSHARLQAMLAHTRTALDFSQEQIKNLKQRNTLTQQLLATTDSMGKANVEIPVRIASERNRQYVLVKNEGASGGWILGMRSDEGTKAKPIKLDIASDEEDPPATGGDDSDMDMEEVEIPPVVPADPDLREYQQTMALAAISRRQSPKSKRLARTGGQGEPSRNRQGSMFAPRDEDQLFTLPQPALDEDGDDPELDLVIQESLDDAEAADLIQAMEQSRQELVNSRELAFQDGPSQPSTSKGASTSSLQAFPVPTARDSDDSYTSPGRLATALAIGGAGPSPTRRTSGFSPTKLSPPVPRREQRLSFGKLSSGELRSKVEAKPAQLPSAPPTRLNATHPLSSRPISKTSPSHTISSNSVSERHKDWTSSTKTAPLPEPPSPSTTVPNTIPPPPVELLSFDNDDDEFVPTGLLGEPVASPTTDDDPRVETMQKTPVVVTSDEDEDMEEVLPAVSAIVKGPTSSHPSPASATPPPLPNELPIASLATRPITQSTPAEESDGSEPLSGWSRSPSPLLGGGDDETKPRIRAVEVPDWDAAQEMDLVAEEGEFARFAAQVKGRNLDAVRQEIDAEIDVLRQQRAVAARDAEDISGQMVAQIMTMLRLFGIPYITAPMEAEAQCAALVQLGLVDGVITDDSDVFLFGGLRVFKNMFNQSKTVECFLLSDLERELGLERGTLIRLAYLLGSDYTDGLPGVGPVVAMELLKEFPGEDGLHRFKDWWVKVQMGRDRPEDMQSKFRKRFKKRFKETLFLPDEWPNPAVRDAYYHPTVDESEEHFKWGLPDIDALRDFLRAELSWNQSKVDDLLLPIIQKQGKRSQEAALNKQGNLNEFLNVAGGSGTAAPRKRQAYASKRLQQIVSDFRSQQARLSGNASESESSGAPSDPHAKPPGTKAGHSGSETESDYEEGGAAKKRKRTARGKAAGKTKAVNEEEGGGKPATRGRRRGSARGTARGRSGRGNGRKGKARAAKESDGDEAVDDEALPEGSHSPPPPPVKLRPRPKPRPRRKATEDGGEAGTEAM